MREDPTKPEGYASSNLWAQQRHTEDLVVPNREGAPGGADAKDAPARFKSNSLSGNERNRLFLHTGENYEDLTLVSGADFLADGRGFAWTDFDRDGFLDMIVTSLDVPRVRFLRNRGADLQSPGQGLTIRLSGSQGSAQPSKTASNRDAIGARVLLTYPSGRKLALHRQCGEGFSIQNSATLRAPAPDSDFPNRIEVRWPSGKRSEVVPVKGERDYLIAEP